MPRSLPEIQEKNGKRAAGAGQHPQNGHSAEKAAHAHAGCQCHGIEPANKKGEVLIQAGVIKMKVPLESLRVRQQQKSKHPKQWCAAASVPRR